MKYIKRFIEDKIIDNLTSGKVIIIFGPRRVGKTEMLKHITGKITEDYLLLNGEDMEHIAALEYRSSSNYKRLMAGRKLLVIDEAQAVPDIGLKMKLMVDTIPGLTIIATGSSAFDLSNKTGEPLVGRKIEFILFPISQMEFSQTEDFLTTKANLEERLIFGNYPELIHINERKKRIEYLKDLVNSYLLKDLISFEGIKKRDKVIQLLKIIAFRIGSEVSLEGVGNQLQISKNTKAGGISMITASEMPLSIILILLIHVMISVNFGKTILFPKELSINHTTGYIPIIIFGEIKTVRRLTGLKKRITG